MRREAPSSSACKTYEQRSARHHPEVHAPAVRHVVEDGPRASLVVDPNQKSDGPPRVESSIVRELDVAVWFSKELCRSVWSSVRAWSGSDIDKCPRWV